MNRLLAVSGILAMLGGLVLLVIPGPPIPLLDANRQLLAESEAEGVCAGQVYYQTRGAGSEAAMSDCISESDFPTEINHRRVQPGFCGGIITAGLPMTVEMCMEIMEREKFWPTLKGGLTNSWNKRFPYPGELLTSNAPQTGGNDRTGDREEADREEGLR